MSTNRGRNTHMQLLVIMCVPYCVYFASQHENVRALQMRHGVEQPLQSLHTALRNTVLRTTAHTLQHIIPLLWVDMNCVKEIYNCIRLYMPMSFLFGSL